MNISDITNCIWNNCEEINFGNVNTWNADTFKIGWFADNNIADKWDSGSPGWYWFISNISYAQLHQIARPNFLPSSGCDIGLVSHENIHTFGCS